MIDFGALKTLMATRSTAMVDPLPETPVQITAEGLYSFDVSFNFLFHPVELHCDLLDQNPVAVESTSIQRPASDDRWIDLKLVEGLETD